MKILVLDCETSTGNEGNPFDPRNVLCAVAAWRSDGQAKCYRIQHGDGGYGQALRDLQEWIEWSDLLVFFNAKFDLHWLRRYGIRFDHKRIYCVQLAYFTRNGQQPVMPSLDDVCGVLGLGQKLDHIKVNYWDVGIDTPDIPWEELATYALKDVELTYQAYLKLEIPERLTTLVSLAMQDLVVLQEMEWNGLKMNLDRAREKAEELKPQLESLSLDITGLTGLPTGVFNVDSPRHLSAFLYGGTIVHEWKEPDGAFKTGKRVGQPRYRWKAQEYTMPRLCKPPPRSETAVNGVWQTNAKVLGMLNVVGKARKFLDLLAKYAELEKLSSTYYVGIPAMYDKMGWTDSIIHGQYNQCTVITGRLSSSKPNLQNLDGTVDELIITRFSHADQC